MQRHEQTAHASAEAANIERGVAEAAAGAVERFEVGVSFALFLFYAHARAQEGVHLFSCKRTCTCQYKNS